MESSSTALTTLHTGQQQSQTELARLQMLNPRQAIITKEWAADATLKELGRAWDIAKKASNAKAIDTIVAEFTNRRLEREKLAKPKPAKPPKKAVEASLQQQARFENWCVNATIDELESAYNDLLATRDGGFRKETLHRELRLREWAHQQEKNEEPA